MSYPSLDLLYLSEEDMIKAGVTDVVKCTDCMDELLKILDKGDYRMGGENGNSHGCMVTFPDEPEFPHMPKNAPDRRFMAMPAYVGGKFDVAGMKWYGSNVKNREKELPRSILMVMLNDKETGAPLSLMSGNLRYPVSYCKRRDGGNSRSGGEKSCSKKCKSPWNRRPRGYQHHCRGDICGPPPIFGHLKNQGEGKSFH